VRISAIKQQVKRADRYSIFVDEKYTFSLSENGLFHSGLRIGQELTEEELELVQQTASVDKALDRVMGLLARRPRSTWEIESYLKRKDIAEDVAQEVLATLRERGYVDDEDFARRWVENRRLLKLTSTRRLQQELRQKRVPSDIIDRVLQSDETDEKQILKDLIARKQTQTRYHDTTKLMQYLSRQGFSYGDIKEALEESSSSSPQAW
jgi:regulatory protein